MRMSFGVEKIVSGEPDLFPGSVVMPPFQNIDVFIGFGDGLYPYPFSGRTVACFLLTMIRGAPKYG